MSATLLHRYQSGEREEVWQDLVALGSAVRHELFYSDAVAVASETMKRARHNVESIVVKLEKLGYVFASQEPPSIPMPDLFEGAGKLLNSPVAQPGFEPRNAVEQMLADVVKRVNISKEQWQERAPQVAQMFAQYEEQRKQKAAKPTLQNPDVFLPPGKKARADLDRFEEELGGPLPISLRQWYEQVGVVNLMGRHEALVPPYSERCSDPLVIYPYREAPESDGPLDERESETIELTLAPDALHKEDVSGGPPYSMKVPDPAADAPFLWEPHQTTFVDYLRQVFAWGGFPGWENRNERPQKELDFLREDLLPL